MFENTTLATVLRMDPGRKGCTASRETGEGGTEMVRVRGDGGSNLDDGGRQAWEDLGDVLEAKLTVLDDKFAVDC